jgi:hypothetical protein
MAVKRTQKHGKEGKGEVDCYTIRFIGCEFLSGRQSKLNKQR